MSEEKWVSQRSWEEFRKTGLFMFVNTILHTFGWALVIETDHFDSEDIVKVYPARVKYRGFDPESQTEMHKKIGTYLKENADELQKETEL